MAIEPPVIIVGDGQVELFGSMERVEASVEAVDAELYHVYDSAGRPIRLSGQYKTGRFLFLSWVDNGPVRAELASDVPTHATELRLALSEWWVRTGGMARREPEPDISNWSLRRLVESIATRDGVK